MTWDGAHSMSGGRPTTTHPKPWSAKYSLAKSRHLAGIGLWALGYDTGSVDDWKAIATVYRPFLRSTTRSFERLRRSIGPRPSEKGAKAQGPGQVRTAHAPGVRRRLRLRPAGIVSPVHRRIVPAAGQDGQPVAPGAVRRAPGQHRPSRTPDSETVRSIEPEVTQDRLDDDRPGRQQAGPGGVDRVAHGSLGGRLAARSARAASNRSRSRTRSSVAAGRTLTRLEAVPPTAISSRQAAVGNSGDRSPSLGPHCVDLVPCWRIVTDERGGQASPPDP